MTCHEAQERLIELFDLNHEHAGELRRHVEACAQCGREYEAMKATVARIAPDDTVRASVDFKERVMNKALEPAVSMRPARRFASWLPKAALVGAAAFGLVIALPFLTDRKTNTAPAPVMRLLAQSVQAASNLQSVHLSARMRTLPRDNFEMIGLNYEFVPIEMWKQFGDPPKWRVQKPGRVVVMDGTSTTLLIEPNSAVRGGVETGMVGWLKPLLDVDQLLEREQQMARTGVSRTQLAEVNDNQGRHVVLTVDRKAEGDLTNDWLRNKAVIESDHTRVYRFDATSNRLEGLQVFVHANGQDVLVFEVTGVRYDESMDPALFALELPPDVNWILSPEQMPVMAGAAPTNAKEAAELFFQSLAAEDYQRVLTVYPVSRIDPKIRQYYGGLKVNSIGESFKSGLYPGWFVPYEITLKNGEVKKHNLAVRNDNRAKRFQVDGGF